MKKILLFLLLYIGTILGINAANCTPYGSWDGACGRTPPEYVEFGGRLYYNAAGWWQCGDPSTGGIWVDQGVCTAEPAVTTNDESGVTSSSITLNGTVDNGAGISDRGFIYGTNSADVTSSSIGSLDGTSVSVSEGGTTLGAFSKGISSLCSGITYYFKAYATNTDGIGYGNVTSGTTTSPGTYTSTQDGAFTSASTWGGCGPPDLSIGNTINIGHTLTSSGLTITEGTDITVTSGGVLTNTGNITFGGTSTPTFTIDAGATVTTTNVTYTNIGTLTSNGTLTITNNLTITNGGNALLGGTTIINGNATNNAPGNFTVTGGTLQVDGNIETSSDGKFTANGTVTIDGDWQVYGSGGATVGGTVTATGLMTVSSNGYITGTGVIGYGTKNINPDNSGAYVGCVDETKWDDNAGTPTWDEIDNPWDLTTCAKSLPVELISFTVTSSKYGVNLKWVTGSEINNSHFEIQVSNDGIYWEVIGIVKGMGNSYNITNYFEVINTDKKYVRLKQVDFDGAYEYSKIRTIDKEDKLELSSTLNYITINGPGVHPVNIYNISGQLVYTNKYEGSTLIIDKSILSVGWAVIRVGSLSERVYITKD